MEKNKNPGNEKLKFENELRKLKLQATHGAKFHPGDSELPPDVESKWLDNIMAFERSFDKKEVKKIHDLLGKPSMPIAKDLSDDRIGEALAKVNELLGEKDIVLDVLYDVSDSEVYRFITEELFQYEVQVIQVPGMITHFTYEEFYPNDEEDLKRYSEEFINMLMKQNFEFMDHTLSSEIIYQDKMLPSKTFIHQTSNKLNDLELTLTRFEVDSIDIKADKAIVKFLLSYEIRSASKPKANQVDRAELGFIQEFGYWSVQSASIPGLNI